MGTKTKVVLLESVGGIIGWVWIGAFLSSIYFLIMIIFFNASWSQLFWAIGIGTIAKWIAIGLKDSANRVFFEANLIQQGYSKNEAGKIWLEKYTGINSQSEKSNKNTEEIIEEDFMSFINDMKKYIKYFELNPISVEEIRHTSNLPIKKDTFLKKSLFYIKYLEDDVQKVLLEFIPLLAFFRHDIPENGYLSVYDKVLKDENFIKKLDGISKELSKDVLDEKKASNEILNELSKDIHFPNDLLIECQNDSQEILKLLEKTIQKN